MEREYQFETINGQVIGKSNHYLSVPGKGRDRRIIKDEAIRNYERSFCNQCKIYRDRNINSRFDLIVRVYHSSARFDLDNALKTILDCLQYVHAITDDNLCYSIQATKFVDKYNPRIEYALVERNEQKSLFSA